MYVFTIAGKVSSVPLLSKGEMRNDFVIHEFAP